eukprot:TRINITY_DN8624_c0_g1_i1.p3 TRINITY_DN8624_c0_g1~~TRINITY_DN8624_c0_g1_i1.p3  ORF type:complete len:147 (+),score=37.63 TRINITY_DN8624_c0_g1_i1:1132-1572(+)
MPSPRPDPPEDRPSRAGPEPRTMNAVWRLLLQKSDHRRFATAEAVDELLEAIQRSLLPRDTGAPGCPRDLKSLGPEDRLKIRIRGLQLLGEQVLGPRLFSQIYSTLKKPMEPAKHDLLEIAATDPVLHAMVEHTSQLLLCETLYFG